MPVKIRITSLETPEEYFAFEAPSLALVVAKVVTELVDIWTFAYDEELATLLKTIAEAIESDEKTAQEWDFSSPGDAYKVEIEETADTEVVDAIQVTEVQDANNALPIAPDASPIPAAKLITAVEQRTQYGDCRVTATFDDGSTAFLFAYYVDELSFSDSEFIGLTQKEAMQLRHRKDVAYLQS